MFLVVFLKESSIRNGWHGHHGACECCQVNVRVKKSITFDLSPFSIQTREGVGWGGVGWDVNVPWHLQSRLVAIFGRDPGEVQARSRRDQKLPKSHRLSSNISPALCFVHPVFCTYSLFVQILDSRAGRECLPARGYITKACLNVQGQRDTIEWCKTSVILQRSGKTESPTTQGNSYNHLHGTHEKLTINHQLEKTSTC